MISELTPTGRASVAQRMMAKMTTAITLCPDEDRPATGGRRRKIKNAANAKRVLYICFNIYFLSKTIIPIIFFIHSPRKL
jgi:hypothetical protein